MLFFLSNQVNVCLEANTSESTTELNWAEILCPIKSCSRFSVFFFFLFFFLNMVDVMERKISEYCNKKKK